MSNLVVTKDFGNNITVQKYKKKVFYDNLWNTDAELMESRGKIKHDGKVIALPFKKVFNYLENDTSYPLNYTVCAVEKINGFMFHVTAIESVQTSVDMQEALKLDDIPYHVYGTTGSIDSDFVTMGKRALIKHNVNTNLIGKVEKELLKVKNLHTYIFEIKDNVNDPHIIFDEADGVYLLGVRDIVTGKLLHQYEVDELAKAINAKRPKWKNIVFGELLKEVKTVRHEGFVVYDLESNDAILKLKSPFYTIKKWYMRRNNDYVFRSNYKQLVDEEYYPVIKKIRKNHSEEEWMNLDKVAKGELFEKYLSE